MTLMKNTKITERVNLEMRWEVYNILNRGKFLLLPGQHFRRELRHDHQDPRRGGRATR